MQIVLRVGHDSIELHFESSMIHAHGAMAMICFPCLKAAFPSSVTMVYLPAGSVFPSTRTSSLSTQCFV